MTEEILRATLEAAEAKADEDGWAELPEGQLMTLYVAHEGVSLNIAKVEALKISHGLVKARSSKGDVFVLALKDVFATALDASARSTHGRKTGFLG